MKRLLFGTGPKRALALLGGGALVLSGAATLAQTGDAKGARPGLLGIRQALAAEGFTGSVLESTMRRVPLPWDQNWDKRDPDCLVKPLKADATDDEKDLHKEKILLRTSRSKRIIVLVRHGQYNDKGKEDSERYLTELGREQADFTGQRLAEMYKHLQSKMGYDENENQLKLELNFIVSTMARATETAKIILKHFPGKTPTSCDMIREGAPCEPVPGISPTLWNPSPQAFYEDGARIEAAFRKYIHRAEASQLNDSIDIIICHANVIRYFVCRALQLPPEAWLRFSLHNGSFTVMTIQPNGRVSVSMLGETGHFPIEKLTFN